MVDGEVSPAQSVFRWKGRVFRTKAEALKFCMRDCGAEDLGCAVNCPLRRHFRIPPHGESYQ